LTALGLLFFISGYLIGIKQVEFNVQNILCFVGRRFIRIYPPFLVAVFLFYFLEIIDRSSAIRVALLITPFLSPVPKTLWFIPVIFFYYLIAPIFYSYALKRWQFLLLTISLISVLTLYSFYTNWLDKRVILYLPSFLVGLFVGKNSLAISNVTIWKLLPILPIALFIGFITDSGLNLSNYLMSPFVTILTLVIFILTSKTIENNISSIISSIVKKLSYASYFMYLSHRPIYTTLLNIWTPVSQFRKFLYLVLVCLPSIVVVSWILQRTYDLVCEKLHFSRIMLIFDENKL
jgi:peptidoglycan/LPS O-acetylase OafA/YrhL